MGELNGWGPRRYATLLAVSVAHAALVAVLVMASRSQTLSASASRPLELLLIVPTKPPKVRSQNSPPQRLSDVKTIKLAPPVLDSPETAQSPSTSGMNSNGTGVDWSAEARRALQAFEIRSHQPPRNSSSSGSPAEGIWWQRPQHHAGEQFKTASGDWMVWINSSCYQTATSAATGSALPTLHRTICPDESTTPSGETSDQRSHNSKAPP